MKNKKILTVIITALIAVLSFTVAGCSIANFATCEKMLTNSANTLVYVKTQFDVTDANEKVFMYSESVEIIDGNAEIVKSTSRLNPSYEFSTIEDNSFVENVDRASLLNFSFNKKYFKEYSLEKGVFTATVTGYYLDEFLNGAKITIKGDANVVLTFENEILKSAEIAFKLQSGKQVKMTVECKYEENNQYEKIGNCIINYRTCFNCVRL